MLDQHTSEKTTDLSHVAQSVIAAEISAINELPSRIDSTFLEACKQILHCEGHLIVLGMGKSGHIARKIAATLASTGTPAFYIHPGEACHGDMGMIRRQDIVLAISYSGETEEILNILPAVRYLGVPIIAMTGRPQSTLGKAAHFCLNVGISQEACPLGLAPTSSTTATLVLGDALAITLLEARGFTADDFARNHPEGSLGRKLLLRIRDIMHVGEHIPKVHYHCFLKQALLEITQKRFGMTTIVNDEEQLVGLYTDGDLRRTLDHNHDIHSTLIHEVMTANPTTIPPDLLAADALYIMNQQKITSLVVVDEKHSPIGLVHLHDLIRAGI